jgi:hypothetical protein
MVTHSADCSLTISSNISCPPCCFMPVLVTHLSTDEFQGVGCQVEGAIQGQGGQAGAVTSDETNLRGQQDHATGAGLNK